MSIFRVKSYQIDYACRRFSCISSDPGSLPGISTPSNGVVAFDATPLKYIEYVRNVRRFSCFKQTTVLCICSLQFFDKGLYIGFTKDLKQRLLQHSKRQVASTKIRAPFLLIHYEYFINQKDAKAREVFLKSGYGRDQLKNIIKNTFSFINSHASS